MVWQLAEDFPTTNFVYTQGGTVHAVALYSSDGSVKTACGRFGWVTDIALDADPVCIQCDQALARLVSAPNREEGDG